jgi:hypothetical protein
MCLVVEQVLLADELDGRQLLHRLQRTPAKLRAQRSQPRTLQRVSGLDSLQQRVEPPQSMAIISHGGDLGRTIGLQRDGAIGIDRTCRHRSTELVRSGTGAAFGWS